MFYQSYATYKAEGREILNTEPKVEPFPGTFNVVRKHIFNHKMCLLKILKPTDNINLSFRNDRNELFI